MKGDLMEWFYSHGVPIAASIGALCAAYWRARAAVVVRGWAPIHLAIGALSLFYAVAWFLLWSDIWSDRATWSQYVGTISALSFVVVWAWPARKAVKQTQARRDAAREAAELGEEISHG